MVGVLLVGMHRSGTSCLAGCLQELGLHLGEVHVRNPHNRKGNRERADVMRLNEALLVAQGGRWDTPVPVASGTPEQCRERDRIVAELRAGGRFWGFKDPRTLFTLGFWREAIPHPRLVGSFRRPLAVAASLNARDGFDNDRGLRLWMRYNQRLLALSETEDLALIPFDLPVEDYRRWLCAVARWLALPRASEPCFFAPELRHQTGDAGDCPSECRHLYRQLLARAERFRERIA